MNFLEAKNAIEKLRDECATVESELRNLSKEWRIINTKRIDFESIHKDLIKQIKHLETIIDNENMFETVNNIEGFDTLLQLEWIEEIIETVVIILVGMIWKDLLKMLSKLKNSIQDGF